MASKPRPGDQLNSGNKGEIKDVGGDRLREGVVSVVNLVPPAPSGTPPPPGSGTPPSLYDEFALKRHPHDELNRLMASGSDGEDGPQGPPGLAGAAGAAGVAGPPGPEGAEGPEGPQGPAGVDGAPGATGAAGAASTEPGPMGPPGAEGPQGEQGDVGLAGPTGATGAAGAAGADGLMGPPGIPGEDGADGARGSDGATGATGATGPAGVDGLLGPRGADGEDGVDGRPGIDGVSVTGADGRIGPPGADGDDATIWPTPFVHDHPAVASGSANIKSTEQTFGATGVYFAEWTIVDVDVLSGSNINAKLSAEPPTGRDGDEAEMEPMEVYAKDIIAGQFTLVAEVQDGPVDGAYVFNYLVG